MLHNKKNLERGNSMKTILGVIGAALVLSACSSIRPPCEGNDVNQYDCEGNPVAATTAAGDVTMTVTVQAAYQQKLVIKKDGKTHRTLTGTGVGKIYSGSAPAGTYTAEGFWRDGDKGSWTKSNVKVSKSRGCTIHGFDDTGPMSEVDYNDIVLKICK